LKRIEETLARIAQPAGPRGGAEDEVKIPMPAGGLGQLGALAASLRAIYAGREVGRPLRKLLLIAAADHGAGRRRVSRYPQETTAGLVRDVLEGRAAVAKIAPRLQVRAIVTDVGVEGEVGSAGTGWAEYERVPVERGTKDISEGPAMSRQTALECIRAGIESLGRWSEGWNVDLLATGDLGLGSTVSACATAAALTGRPVDELCGREAEPARPASRGASRAELVWKALDRASPDPDDAVGLLAEYGGLEIGALAGACLEAAARRIPVLLDGVVSAAAAALAASLAPASRSYFIASHRARMPAHAALLEHLGLEPLLRLDLDLGEGAGAVLAMGLVEAAWELAGAG
jgi:nicotinate-nucleotide--dimethylbenzimidazole phosphoribosyltransferase